MNPLRAEFDGRTAARRPRLLPYVTAGYPDLATTAAILRRLDPRDCRCVELGIPFSDPIADGPVIQASFSRALAAGFQLDELFATLAEHRAEIATPVLAMVSYSIVYRRGPGAFVERARATGFDGLIVPDLAIEEAEGLAEIGERADCPLVMMVAPTSDDDRRRRIADLSAPFIYYQSVAGTTGERDALPPDLVQQVQSLRAASGKPVCVGFGISRPEQVAAVCAVADGAIVGSGIVRRMTTAIDAGGGPNDVADAVSATIANLCAQLSP
ncbi:MAG: tryptophan synthase subunit alpha [Phycisphaerae bacterium]|jgi:tryptophan synthase alpha chain